MTMKNRTLFKTAFTLSAPQTDQLLRFCQATRLQYAKSHILLRNRCILQQQHVNCKIVDAHLQKGTKQDTDGWDTASKAWAHRVLHLPHAEGGFGVASHDVNIIFGVAGWIWCGIS
jgi:hypothetical protein